MKFLNLLIGCLLTLVCYAQTPNILLVILDDVGVGEIPRYEPLNTTKANMSNLEKLMDEGLAFDNVWSNPVCSSSRANILTGKHGIRTGVLNPGTLSRISEDETSLHRYIREVTENEYSTSLIGKWHLSGQGMNGNIDYPLELGVGYFAGSMGGGLSDYYNHQFVKDGIQSISTVYATTQYTNEAIEWIEDQNGPWFCWLAYNAPHTPFHLPPSELHSYDDLSSDPDSIASDPTPYFHAMIESTDTEIGRLLESLPPADKDNTIVIVIGDNGTSREVIQRPYTRQKGKGSLFQGGVHVPMVISGAGVNRVGQREDALVSFSDLFSTIVEMTGNDLEQFENSLSFHHLLSDAAEGQRECMYTEFGQSINRINWASRDHTYKYINDDNGEAFYNLIDDPYENSNLLPTLNTAEQTAFDKLSRVQDNLTHTVQSDPVVDLDIFPNPAKDVLIVETDEISNQAYQILDINGKVMQTGILKKTKNEIFLEGMTSGTYIFKASDGQVYPFVKIE